MKGNILVQVAFTERSHMKEEAHRRPFNSTSDRANASAPFLSAAVLLPPSINREEAGRRGYTEPISHLITRVIKLWQQSLTRNQCTAAEPPVNSFQLRLTLHHSSLTHQLWPVPTNAHHPVCRWGSFPEIPFHSELNRAKHRLVQVGIVVLLSTSLANCYLGVFF